MVSDPAVLDVELDVDDESYREEVEAAKRDLRELREACEAANDAYDRLQDRDPITVEAEVDVSSPADGEED